MAEKNEEDLYAQWRNMRDSFMETWAKTMVETVNSEAYAEASGAMLNTFLTAYAPMRDLMEKAVTRSMEQLSVPTRSDVVSLAERLTNLEMRLDDMDVKLDRIAASLTALAGRDEASHPVGTPASRSHGSSTPKA